MPVFVNALWLILTPHPISYVDFFPFLLLPYLNLKKKSPHTSVVHSWNTLITIICQSFPPMMPKICCLLPLLLCSYQSWLQNKINSTVKLSDLVVHCRKNESNSDNCHCYIEINKVFLLFTFTSMTNLAAMGGLVRSDVLSKKSVFTSLRSPASARYLASTGNWCDMSTGSPKAEIYMSLTSTSFLYYNTKVKKNWSWSRACG